MKIGVLIPTRGDRSIFLEHAKKLIGKQTMKPDLIEIVDDKPLSKGKDITWRYRLGCERLFSKGADVIIFWEDDDWYSPLYIQTLFCEWLKAGKPDIFGINTTVYYHLRSRKYVELGEGNKKASAMATMVTKSVINIPYPSDDYVWFDIWIWERLKGFSIPVQRPLNLGIKHGIGLTGGIGHNAGASIYKKYDYNLKYLHSVVDSESFQFYKKLCS